MHVECPDFDLCVACEALPIPVHDANHPMLKIKTDRTVIPSVHGAGQTAPSRCTRNMRRCSRDDDNSRPLPTPPMLHPHFHSAPAPLTEVLDAVPPVPAAPIVHRASCNICDSRIYGARFKCLNCLGMSFLATLNGPLSELLSDFDTCTACFEITPEQHPGHGFVKISNPSDLMVRPMSNEEDLRHSFAIFNKIRDALSANVIHRATCDSCNQTIFGIRWKVCELPCPI